MMTKMEESKEFWMLTFELIGAVYHRWGRPEAAEKFFYGNAHNFRLGKL